MRGGAFFAAAAAIIAAVASQTSAFAEPKVGRDYIDSLLTRALLERGAMIACAGIENDAKLIEVLITSWHKDAAGSAKLLREVGYPDDYIEALMARLDIEKATPKFPDRTALITYCNALGDWKLRWEMYMIAAPQFEIKRALDQ
ncbi:hypothetical protein [Hyphomicrobium sp. 99]|uniref:hypothetical protein n=1 Tax=Hyphomicrobium sp. 99 TaxID=1163419 RepID=UPI0005F88287|nr:hypothetical protein [Hyphomicrobium sp. 99]